jgi:hypothetical protein
MTEYIVLNSNNTSACTIGLSLLNWYFDDIQLRSKCVSWVRDLDAKDLPDLYAKTVGGILMERHGLWEDFMENVNGNPIVFHLWTQMSSYDREDINRRMAQVIGSLIKNQEKWKDLAKAVKENRKILKRVARVVNG